MELSLHRTALFLAPSFYFASGFFWQANGLYSITGGCLLIIGSVFYVLVFITLFDLLRDKLPRYAAFGKLLAIYGCVCGGVAFGLRDVFMDMFAISHSVILQAFAEHPVVANIIFWIGGPVFPLSFLVLGVVLSVKKAVPAWVGILLAISGALFPLSRILRIEMLGHAVDVLMLVPLWYIAAHLQPEKPCLGYKLSA